MRRMVGISVFLVAVSLGPVLLAQAAGAALSGAAGPSNEWGGTVTWGFFASSALEWLKRNPKFSFISPQTSFWTMRIISILIASAAALGVHYTYDPQAGQLIVDGLTVAGLWTMGAETVRQWVAQEIMFRVTVKPAYKAAEAGGTV